MVDNNNIQIKQKSVGKNFTKLRIQIQFCNLENVYIE